MPLINNLIQMMARAIFHIVVILIVLTAAPGVIAQPTDDTDYNTLTLYWENDTFADTDRDYTNGIKLTWSTPYRFDETKTRLPKWSYPLVNRLPFIKDMSRQRSVSISLGQNIYTPEDIEETELIENDRPYAGILYLAFGFHSKKDRRKDSWEFDIGMIGPNSYAEETQNWVHKVTGSDEPQGWENQLENEVSLEVIYETQWRLLKSPVGNRFGYDFIPHIGARLGNVQIYFNTGAEFRVGWNLVPNFGTCPIRPGCETDSVGLKPFKGSLFSSSQLGLHLFVAADGRVVLRDIFLDGNTFKDSHSVEKENFVGDLMGGIGFVWGRVKGSYAYVYRTKQFETQKEAQVFGAFTLSVSF